MQTTWCIIYYSILHCKIWLLRVRKHHQPESKRPDRWGVSHQRCNTSAARKIPHHDCTIFITRSHVATVWRHRQRQNHTPVTNEYSDTLPTLDIPQSNCFVAGTSGNVVAVGMPLDTLLRWKQNWNIDNIDTNWDAVFWDAAYSTWRK